MKNNDDKILKLKEQIKAKKANLSKIGKFTPITNCSIEVNGKRYNIHTLNSSDKIIPLMVEINIYRHSASELKFEEQFLISGYTPDQWLIDLQSKLSQVSRKDEEDRLKSMESKLEKLLSDDKRVELEIEEIMKSI